MSNYLIVRHPDRFGGQQQDYIEQINTIVSQTANAFRIAVESKADLIELFHQTLASLGTKRKQIALKHGTKNADFFGSRRDQKPFAGVCAFTSLTFPYDEYHKRLMPLFQKHVSSMKHDLKSFHQTELRIPSERFLGRESSIEFAILSGELAKQWALSFTVKEYQRLCELCSISCSEKPGGSLLASYNDLVGNIEAMRKLREVSIDDYKRTVITQAILEFTPKFEGKKSDWVLVTVRSEIDGKIYPFSQYLTWLYRDFQNDPVKKMKDHSIISILHQDLFLVDVMLNDIAKIFKKVLGWNGEDIKTLKNDVALFLYEFDHAMPFKRGTSAVSEWLEMAIYLYHGFNVTYNPGKMVNLEALISTPKQFAEDYDSMIQLEKLEYSSSQECGA